MPNNAPSRPQAVRSERMTAPRARNTYGEGEVDRLISELVAAVGLDANDDLIRRMIVTALDMDASEVARLDLKIASQSMVEMLNGYQVFSQDPHRAKVTVFGSARTKPEAADYRLAIEFGRAMAAMEWMVISGAGPGIMHAAIEGAGVENTYGVNIVLPFEQRASDIIDGDHAQHSAVDIRDRDCQEVVARHEVLGQALASLQLTALPESDL